MYVCVCLCSDVYNYCTTSRETETSGKSGALLAGKQLYYRFIDYLRAFLQRLEKVSKINCSNFRTFLISLSLLFENLCFFFLKKKSRLLRREWTKVYYISIILNGSDMQQA